MRFYFSGIAEFSKSIEVKKLAAHAAAAAILREMATTVERQAKTNATGRPGPNVYTGALRSSLTHTSVKKFSLGTWYIEVGPTMPYGRRIELGFTGTDSLGRHYDQQPYPYLGPAVGFLERVAGPVIIRRFMNEAIDA